MHRHNRTIGESDLFDGTARLYSGGPPCVAHSVTSTLSAEAIEAYERTGRAIVHRFLLERAEVGATDQEIQDATGLDQNTERPRRVWLMDHGIVKDSGLTRRTKSGRKAVVWVIA